MFIVQKGKHIQSTYCSLFQFVKHVLFGIWSPASIVQYVKSSCTRRALYRTSGTYRACVKE